MTQNMFLRYLPGAPCPWGC